MWNGIKKKFVIVVIGLVILTNVFPNSIAKKDSAAQSNEYTYVNDKLDIDYIYNITKALSNIIFTEYDEENGEIAKGRAFGTKGEHKASDILYENMSKLGLYTYKEQMENNEDYPKLTHEVEIVDYFVKINDKKVDSYISPVWIKTPENNHNINYTYNYTGLKVILPPLTPGFYVLKQLLKDELEPFVIILKDKTFYQYDFIKKFPFLDNFYFTYYVVLRAQLWLKLVYSRLWGQYLDYCKGIIFYDFNEDVYNMVLNKNFNHMPFIYINRSNGGKIIDDIKNTRIDFKLEQHLNTSVISYNVIGQLNGTNPNKTVIIDCLYDSWWNQGTADSAIGMAMTLGIAKYFTDNNIKPKYTIKFIGFGGEEHGFCAGSKYYESLHKDEEIEYVIDLNQLAFKQNDSKLILDIIGNKLDVLLDIKEVVEKTNYANRVESSKKMHLILVRNGGPSNSQPFAVNRDDCKTICFVKDGGWQLHHRDGQNHTEGDVLKYFDPEDVNVTGEMILNVVKYLATEW